MNNIRIKILKKESDDLQRSEKEILEYIVGVAKNNNQVTVKEIEKTLGYFEIILILALIIISLVI